MSRYVSRMVPFSIKAAAKQLCPPYYTYAAEIAAAAVEYDVGISEKVVEEWLELLYSAGAYKDARILVVAVMKKGRISLAGFRTYMDDCINIYHWPDGILVLAQTAIDSKIPGWEFDQKDINQWANACALCGAFDKAFAIVGYVLESEKFDDISAGDILTADDIRKWGEQAAGQNPVTAVELALAARDIGLDIPQDAIDTWRDMCFAGKTPEEQAESAIALLQAYSRTDAVQADPAIMHIAQRFVREHMDEAQAQLGAEPTIGAVKQFVNERLTPDEVAALQ